MASGVEDRAQRYATRVSAAAVTVPMQAPRDRVRNFDEVYLPWSPDMVIAEASRCLGCEHAPCVRACPLHTPVPEILRLCGKGELRKAAERLQVHNNLAAICGRICPQEVLCEGACRGAADGYQPIAIGRIETFLGDQYRRDHGWGGSRVACTGRRVAVVGAGPAGLTVAERLAELGHSVTVFEQWPAAGGLLRYGVPRFKLDHGLIRRHVHYLRTLGVEFIYDTRIGEVQGLDDLLDTGFDAVFLGTGAGAPIRLEIPGVGLRGVYEATAFLVQANVEQDLRPSELEEPPSVGRRVVVIGGGDTAVDCARTAVRMGAEEVICAYRRSAGDMPANVRDRVLAGEEGVRFEWRASPKRILGDDSGKVCGVEFLRTRPGEIDTTGRPRPVPMEGTHFCLPADAVILAIGYRPGPSPFNHMAGLRARADGALEVDPATGRTPHPRVWAGGDNVLGPSVVGKAVAQARLAAADIHAYLAADEPAEW